MGRGTWSWIGLTSAVTGKGSRRDDVDFVVQTATTRPTVLGKPFTRWSIRKLAD